MKLLTAAQMAEMDRFAIEALGISSVNLMKNASRQIADTVLELLPDRRGNVVAFCGAGNNGGDGIGAAGYLNCAGVKVRAFLIGSRAKMSPESREMERLLIDSGGILEEYDRYDAEESVENCHVIIDAIFGIGLKRDLDGDPLEAVEIMNNSSGKVLSADVPTGVNADTGRVMGSGVKADVTVTFTAPKPGLFLASGAVKAGRVLVRDIGIPEEMAREVKSDIFVVTDEDISIPRREKDSHKYDFGHAMIIAGSRGYTGAPVLAARGCSKTGAGLVTLAVPEGIYPVVAGKCLGEMVMALSGNESVSGDSWMEIQDKAKKCDVLLIGPGLGINDGARNLVKGALDLSLPLILDADGINVLAENINILDNAKAAVILTPHDGEFKRLYGEFEKENRLDAARNFAVERGCIVILKGYRTITAFPDGSAYINTTGNPGMAKGGSGDVLAGMITALIAQKFPVKDACIAAVYLHGKAGDIAAKKQGEYSLMPEDIIDSIPQAFLSAKK